MGIEEIERLDGEVRALLGELESRGGVSYRVNDNVRSVVRQILGRDEERDWIGCLTDAMSLIPLGGWFNWNHFGFSFVPTEVRMGVLSNGTDYHPDGRPVSYEATGFDSEATRADLPRLVLVAVIRSWRAPLLRAKARANDRHYVVQTGSNPLLARPDGSLTPLDYDAYLTADGRLVPHDERVHGDSRIAEPDA